MMNTVDLFILLPIAIGFVLGLFKGFVREIVGLVGVVLAVVGAEMFTPKLAPMLLTQFEMTEKTATTVSYVIIFMAVMIVLFFLSKLFTKMIRSLELGWLNTLGGAVVGALKFAIIVSIVVNVFDALDSRFHFVKPEVKTNSVVIQPILRLSPRLWEESKEWYNSMSNMSEKKTNTEKYEEK